MRNRRFRTELRNPQVAPFYTLWANRNCTNSTSFFERKKSKIKELMSIVWDYCTVLEVCSRRLLALTLKQQSKGGSGSLNIILAARSSLSLVPRQWIVISMVRWTVLFFKEVIISSIRYLYLMNDGVSLFSFVFASCENTMAANSKCSVIPESRRKALSLLFFLASLLDYDLLVYF